MKLKTRIALLPVIAALIFSIGVSLVLVYSARTSAAIHGLGASDYPYLLATSQVASQLESLGTTIQTAVAEGEKKRLEEAGERAAAIRKLLASLKDVPGHAATATALSRDFEAYFATSVETAELFLGVRQGDQAGAIPRMQAAQKALDERLSKAQAEARSSFDDSLSRAEAGVNANLWSTLLGGVVVVVGLGIGSWLLIGNIWRQLGGEPEYARHVMQRMAQGDLSQPIDVAADAETSLLAAIREMSGGLADIISNVRTGAESMTMASREIAAGNQDLSARTELQAGSLEQTASNMQQLTQTVKQSADSASQANGLASSAAGVAHKGGQVVRHVVATMEEISASSRRISDIIGVIDGIAFQTNILALNAAVEAARAGEQGRGFAVVASEVRSLAQRSAEAAREIKSLIVASVERVDSGSRLVDEAGQTMGEIVSSVQRVSDIISEISAASAEQSAGIEHVNASVVQLDQMTQQNAALVEQAAAAATSLEQQSQALQSAVERFKIPPR